MTLVEQAQLVALLAAMVYGSTKGAIDATTCVEVAASIFKAAVAEVTANPIVPSNPPGAGVQQ